MLAGNRLSALPDSLADLHNLELLRIAANRLDALPGWLAELPRLAWLAFAGNPCSDASEAQALREHPLPPIARATLNLGAVLGQGASGVIHRAEWHQPGQPPRGMAAKLFKGEVTSDGLPHSEEAACLAAWFSQGREGKKVPVDYTPVKYVKKPAGARPGMVIYTTYQTAYVDPDPTLAERLKA